MTTKIAEFLHETKASDSHQDASTSRQARFDRWLSALDDLYEKVERWLNESIRAGDASTLRIRAFLHEEAYGSYECNKLLITVGSRTISVEPRGAFVLGAEGRVDMSGPHGRQVVLVLLGGEWYFTTLSARSRREKPALLDEDGFLDILRKLLSTGSVD
jgi:hypothetical protein